MIRNVESNLKEAINMLEYAILNRTSLSKVCIKYNKSDKFLRQLRQRTRPENDKEQLLYNQFITKYNEFLGTSPATTDDKKVIEEENDPTLLSNDSQLPDEEQQIKTETSTTLELDCRGKEIIKTAEQMIKAAEVDLNFWKLEREVVNKWDVTMKLDDGSIKTAQNFQVKLWLSKKQEAVQTFNAVQVFKELLAEIPTRPEDRTLITSRENFVRGEKNLLEINIFDLHIGKLCWAGETGENYDVKIAARRFLQALQQLLKRAESFHYERILFPIGNDFFNVDTMLNTTTEGTPQDEDVRWQKTFKLGVELLVKGIDLMREHAPVDIVIIPGNHDFTRSFYLGESLSAWYRNDEGITVDTHASPRKYYKYGEVLLGLTHGNNEKEAALPQIMAVENRKQWAESTFHEWHLGHFHKKKTVKYQVLDENLGVTVRYLSSLTGKDAWHHKKGYVGTNKAAEAFLWNYSDGFVGQFNVNIIDEDME